MKKDNSNLGTVLLASLAAGAAVWYFLKTEKGKETCEHLVGSLKDFGNTVKEKATDKFDQYSGQAGEIIDGLKSKANNM